MSGRDNGDQQHAARPQLSPQIRVMWGCQNHVLLGDSTLGIWNGLVPVTHDPPHDSAIHDAGLQVPREQDNGVTSNKYLLV